MYNICIALVFTYTVMTLYSEINKRLTRYNLLINLFFATLCIPQRLCALHSGRPFQIGGYSDVAIVTLLSMGKAGE